MGAQPSPSVVERHRTERGELVLRRAGEHFEIIVNGVFLMDTRDGRAERALVRGALAGARDARLLLGGLGIGFSLDEALRHPGVARVTIVELEAAVVAWAAGPLRPLGLLGLSDDRTRAVIGDVADHLTATDESYDAICLDTDNGPDWLVHATNARLYDSDGLELVRARLRDGGRAAFWAAAPSAAFAARLRDVFPTVRETRIPVPRGPDDVVYVGVLGSEAPARPARWASSSRTASRS